jgi:hypothetical protein
MVEISDEEVSECVYCLMIARDAYSCIECGCLVCEEHVKLLNDCPKCRGLKDKLVPCPYAR